MTLSKGNKLFKVSDQGDVTTRLRTWLESHDGEITDKELSDILSNHESYAIHEVMTDVHYQSHNEGFSFAPAVDLKVLY